MAVIAPPSMQFPHSVSGNPLDGRVISAIPPTSANPIAGGLAFYPHQRSYEGLPLVRATPSIIRFRATRSGSIVNVYLWVSQVSGSGTSYYNILKNGAGLWTGSNRLPVTSGSTSPLKEGLSLPVTRGDMLTLELESFAVGQVHSAPIAVLLEIE